MHVQTLTKAVALTATLTQGSCMELLMLALAPVSNLTCWMQNRKISSHCSATESRCHKSSSHPSNCSQSREKNAHTHTLAHKHVWPLSDSRRHFIFPFAHSPKTHMNHLCIQKHFSLCFHFWKAMHHRGPTLSLNKLLLHPGKCVLIAQSLKWLVSEYCVSLLLLTTEHVVINPLPFLCAVTGMAFLQRNLWQRTSTSTRNISPGMQISSSPKI